MINFDVIVIGAGAAGLMAAATATKRNRNVLVIDHCKKIGEKIRISGGGRCNFTNLHASPANYISNNPYFAISALKKYTQHDFIKLVEKYNIKYHEKTLGQLFCDGKSQQIIDMLISECEENGVKFTLDNKVKYIDKTDKYKIATEQNTYSSSSLIIATGGLSIPKLGATNFGYKIAKQFGLNIIDTKPALVPLKVAENEIEFYRNLSGVSIYSITHFKNANFPENILFTHRGLSGPAILQISSYLDADKKDQFTMNLLPEHNLAELLIDKKSSKQNIASILKEFLPKKFVDNWLLENLEKIDKPLAEYKNQELIDLANKLHNFKVTTNSCEGYLKAEVTRGGVDTNELSSKTMEAKKVPGLFFIGEVVDVTGWLGGYNFQWAWSSGFVAGSYA